MKLNPQEGTKHVFSEDIPLIKSIGHYPIPITEAKQMIKNIDRLTGMPETLAASNENDSKDFPIVAQTIPPSEPGKFTSTAVGRN